METVKERGAKDDGPVADLPGELPGKVAVARSPTRCPYCHDDCAPEGAVVCEGCLSRHHAGCWREGGERCASCSGTRALRGSEPPKLVVAPAELELLRKGAAREAVERLARRAKVDEARATTALLEAAAAELHGQKGRVSPGLGIAGMLGALALLVPIVAIAATLGGPATILAVVCVYAVLLSQMSKTFFGK